MKKFIINFIVITPLLTACFKENNCEMIKSQLNSQESAIIAPWLKLTFSEISILKESNNLSYCSASIAYTDITKKTKPPAPTVINYTVYNKKNVTLDDQSISKIHDTLQKYKNHSESQISSFLMTINNKPLYVYTTYLDENYIGTPELSIDELYYDQLIGEKLYKMKICSHYILGNKQLVVISYNTGNYEDKNESSGLFILTFEKDKEGENNDVISKKFPGDPNNIRVENNTLVFTIAPNSPMEFKSEAKSLPIGFLSQEYDQTNRKHERKVKNMVYIYRDGDVYLEEIKQYNKLYSFNEIESNNIDFDYLYDFNESFRAKLIKSLKIIHVQNYEWIKYSGATSYPLKAIILNENAKDFYIYSRIIYRNKKIKLIYSQKHHRMIGVYEDSGSEIIVENKFSSFFGDLPTKQEKAFLMNREDYSF